MAWHKRLKAGDVVYACGVRILSKNSASLAIEAEKNELIVHLTNTRPGGYDNEKNTDVKE